MIDWNTYGMIFAVVGMFSMLILMTRDAHKPKKPDDKIGET